MQNDDPFGTAELRRRVLRAWAESPARFREDANAEEDHALGGYRDRVIIELAQNAADAAVRAGVPGRLRLSLTDGVLTASNTGAPLDPAGVEALSTLRASAKRRQDQSVGRFGVGFAAVVAVSDEPAIISRASDDVPDGAARGAAGGRRAVGVAWSVERTRELAGGIPALTGELDHRQGHVPLLRLPFALMPNGQGRASQAAAASETVVPPEGYDTSVRLPLRDADAEKVVRQGLSEVGPALMLALPALETVEVHLDGEVRTVTTVHREADDGGGIGTVEINGVAWRTIEEHGPIDPRLLADRPTEERSRAVWWIRWALPANLDADTAPGMAGGLPGGVPPVIHGPTPSDEPLGLPALLIASFPLAPDRRHVAPGPLTDFLIERAAESYPRLLRDIGPGPRLLDLVPGPVAAGELDARLRREIRAALPDVPLLPVAADPRARIRGRDAVAVDGPPALIESLAEILPALLPSGWTVRHQALTALGVRRMEIADVVDALAGLEREPAWWHRLYSALSETDLDGLGALPVPLATVQGGDDPDPREGWGGGPGARNGGDTAPPDGWDPGPEASNWREAAAVPTRMARGPRGLLVAGADLDPAGLSVLGLRLVHPAATHPLLLRLGAVEAGPRDVLADPAVRSAVADSYDAEDPEAITDAVLRLVAAAHLDPGAEPWLAELTLCDQEGRPRAAGELLLPDSPLREVMAEDSPFGVVADELVERHGADTLEAAGVLRTFALLREEDVALTDLGLDHSLDLDAEEEWADDVLARLPEHDLPPLVPELTAVRDLELVDDWPAALRLFSERALRAALVEPAHVLIGGGRRVAVPSYTAWWLRGQPILDGRRPGELRSHDADPLLGGLYDLAPADLDPDLCRALGVRVSVDELLAEPGGADELLARLADPERTVSREQLHALWTALAVVDDAEPPERVRAVVDGVIEVVPAVDALVLDSPDLLPLLTGQPLVIVPPGPAGRLAALLDVPLAGEELEGRVESSGEPRPVPPVVRQVLADAPATYVHHERLVVDGTALPWRFVDGVVHAGGADLAWALARGLAWAAGRWGDRMLLEAALRDPGALPLLLAESELG